jgi:NAD-dependent dihydropyrimidine dehydrogenase PreA subunit
LEEQKMAVVITDECVSCGDCKDVCPVNAISEGDGKHEVDEDACLDYGACVGTCPHEAIL